MHVLEKIEVRAVVFDLDDTLYAERQFVLSGFRAVAAWAEQLFGFSRTQSFRELKSLFDAGVHGVTFDRWLALHKLEARQWTPVMVDVYRQHTPDICPFPGAAALLKRLRATYRLGLVTDGHGDVQRRKVDACGFAPLFDCIVYSDELGREAWKPSTRPFLAVLSAMSVPGSAAVYVGDNPAKDFRGAKQLGMLTVRFRHRLGLHNECDPESAEDAPHVDLAELSGLEQLLKAPRPWLGTAGLRSSI